MSLFQTGNFTLASGVKSAWKIECDALTAEDWRALALIASQILPPFRVAEGVPRGGVKFAEALNLYASGDASHPLLITEDVVTTGGSMERFRNCRSAIGVAVFSRGLHPDWVTPIFIMQPPKDMALLRDKVGDR